MTHTDSVSFSTLQTTQATNKSQSLDGADDDSNIPSV